MDLTEYPRRRKKTCQNLSAVHVSFDTIGTVGAISYNSEEVKNCETNSGNDTFESGVV